MATGCERDTPLAGREFDPESAAFLDNAGTLARVGNIISNDQRHELGNGVAHYSFDVRFGPGPYELIGVHRVARERRPGHVGRIPENLFLLHGDAKDFAGMFLPGVVGPSTPDDFGLAIHLAENGIDVWGMDQGWCFIPADEIDPSVAEGWGLQRSADDLRLGVAVARMSRLFTGSGGAPLNVLGYRSGVPTIYTAANDEAVLPRGLRNIGGLVPANFFPRTDDASWARFFCEDLVLVAEPALAAGDYLSRIPFDFLADYDRLICGEEDVPWDDNLHLIEVPILNLATRGGADEFGLCTQTLVGSDDFTSVVASTLPIEDILVDFGHIDLFLSPLARDLAWAPLLEWVLEHTPRRGGGCKMALHQN